MSKPESESDPTAEETSTDGATSSDETAADESSEKTTAKKAPVKKTAAGAGAAAGAKKAAAKKTAKKTTAKKPADADAAETSATAEKKPAAKKSTAKAGAKSTTKSSSGAKSATKTTEKKSDKKTEEPAKASRFAALRERMSADDDAFSPEQPTRLQWIIAGVLVLGGLAYIYMTWRALGTNTPVVWSQYDEFNIDKPARWVWELDIWNYVLGLGAVILGLLVAGYRTIPGLLAPRFLLVILMVCAGGFYIATTWRGLGASPLEDWELYDLLGENKPARWLWDLGLWNYAIGFGIILIALVIGAHRSTPLGRGNGVVVGMLLCFAVGLLWICTFYLFADNISDIWVLGALGQWNLVVGIAFFAVGFSYATKWE